jgi:YgiT-type zinc finger domain-containing protein
VKSKTDYNKNNKMRACLECGGVMRFRLNTLTIEYAKRIRAVEIYAWWCDYCKESLLEGDSASIIERAHLELRTEIEF